MVWGLFFALVVLGGLALAVWCASLLFTQKKTPNYEAMVDEVSKRSMQRRNLFLDEFVPLMKSEFPDFAGDFSVASLDKFCDFSINWMYAYHPKDYAEEVRKETIESDVFRNNLQRQLGDLFSKNFAKYAQEDYQNWFNRIDTIIKIAVQKSWVRL